MHVLFLYQSGDLVATWGNGTGTGFCHPQVAGVFDVPCFGEPMDRTYSAPGWLLAVFNHSHQAVVQASKDSAFSLLDGTHRECQEQANVDVTSAPQSLCNKMQVFFEVYCKSPALQLFAQILPAVA
jgi:hypothetical protein